MPRLNSREATLLLVFVGLLFVAGNALALHLWRGHWTELEMRKGQLTAQWEDTEFWLDERAYFEPLINEVREKLQPVGNEETARADLLALCQQTGEQFGVQFKRQRVQPSEEVSGLTKVAVVIDAQASLEPMLRWLAQLQRPAQLQGISDFSLRVDKNPANYVCNIKLGRFFLPGEGEDELIVEDAP